MTKKNVLLNFGLVLVCLFFVVQLFVTVSSEEVILDGAGSTVSRISSFDLFHIKAAYAASGLLSGINGSGYRIDASDTTGVQIERSGKTSQLVTNSNSTRSYFIPTNSDAEWDAFVTAVPSLSGLALDGVCSPSCSGNTCGDDGCGGSCGTCTGGQSCSSGVCSDICTPACGTCTSCSGSSCVNDLAGTDPDNECPLYDCANLTKGWVGNTCTGWAYSGPNNGYCDGSGGCWGSGSSCTGSQTLASCGSAGCKKACPAGVADSGYDSVAEVCYTSGQNGCSSGEVCDATGTCVSEFTCIYNETGPWVASGQIFDAPCNPDVHLYKAFTGSGAPMCFTTVPPWDIGGGVTLDKGDAIMKTFTYWGKSTNYYAYCTSGP